MHRTMNGLGKMALQIICEAVKTAALRSARQKHV
jgi:hypothetical protein